MSTEKAESRALSTQLIKSGDGQFGTHWNYICKHPLELAFKPMFLSPLRGNLIPGDTIRFVEMVSGNRIRGFCDAMVIMELENDILVAPVYGAPTYFDHILTKYKDGRPVEDPKQEKYIGGDGVVKWNAGRKLHQVVLDGEILYETKSKPEAEAIARGDKPIPQAA